MRDSPLARVVRCPGRHRHKPITSGDGFEPHYTLTIEGDPSFTVTIPELILPMNSVVETAANAVNWIPHIIKAKPGLMTDATDFPLVTCLPDES